MGAFRHGSSKGRRGSPRPLPPPPEGCGVMGQARSRGLTHTPLIRLLFKTRGGSGRDPPRGGPTLQRSPPLMRPPCCHVSLSTFVPTVPSTSAARGCLISTTEGIITNSVCTSEHLHGKSPTCRLRFTKPCYTTLRLAWSRPTCMFDSPVLSGPA